MISHAIEICNEECQFPRSTSGIILNGQNYQYNLLSFIRKATPALEIDVGKIAYPGAVKAFASIISFLFFSNLVVDYSGDLLCMQDDASSAHTRGAIVIYLNPQNNSIWISIQEKFSVLEQMIFVVGWCRVTKLCFINFSRKRGVYPAECSD